jgi:hypothetical protein
VFFIGIELLLHVISIGWNLLFSAHSRHLGTGITGRTPLWGLFSGTNKLYFFSLHPYFSSSEHGARNSEGTRAVFGVLTPHSDSGTELLGGLLWYAFLVFGISK